MLIATEFKIIQHMMKLSNFLFFVVETITRLSLLRLSNLQHREVLELWTTRSPTINSPGWEISYLRDDLFTISSFMVLSL